MVLGQVNDTITRSLLRELPRGALDSKQQEFVDKVLAGPALPHGEERAFCESGFGQIAMGATAVKADEP